MNLKQLQARGRLRLVTGDEEFHLLHLEAGDNIIGRASGTSPADVNRPVHVDDHSMSRRHANIRGEMGGSGIEYWITKLRDQVRLRLRLGTDELDLVMGDKVRLEPGCRISMGETDFVFEHTE